MSQFKHAYPNLLDMLLILEAIGLQFEPYQWCPCGVTWDSS